MAKRRTVAAIREVEAIHDRTSDIAREISARVGLDDVVNVSVRAGAYWGVRAEYQRDAASDLLVTFRTKNPAVAEQVAKAIRDILASEGVLE